MRVRGTNALNSKPGRTNPQRQWRMNNKKIYMYIIHVPNGKFMPQL